VRVLEVDATRKRIALTMRRGEVRPPAPRGADAATSRGPRPVPGPRPQPASRPAPTPATALAAAFAKLSNKG